SLQVLPSSSLSLISNLSSGDRVALLVEMGVGGAAIFFTFLEGVLGPSAFVTRRFLLGVGVGGVMSISVDSCVYGLVRTAVLNCATLHLPTFTRTALKPNLTGTKMNTKGGHSTPAGGVDAKLSSLLSSILSDIGVDLAELVGGRCAEKVG